MLTGATDNILVGFDAPTNRVLPRGLPIMFCSNWVYLTHPRSYFAQRGVELAVALPRLCPREP